MEDPTLQHDLESSDHSQTFMIHFFRSEASRETALRQRLDVTANGAVLVTGGVISFAFSSPDVSHFVLMVNIVLIFIFLQIEARRYQVYAMLNYRVRLIEKSYIAPLFNQLATKPKDIRHQPYVDSALIDSLLNYKPPISRRQAIAWRIRRNYIFIFVITYVAWFGKLLTGQTTPSLVEHINQKASIGSISGIIVAFVFTGVLLTIWFISFYVTKVSDGPESII